MPKKTKLKNSNKMDMINGPIWNKLPRFALPVAATAILEQLFNASDLAVVGNFTGAAKTASVAAVGANSPVIGLILNLFIGIALGTNVIIANAIGRDDRETVQRAVHTSVLTAIIGGFLVMIPGEIFAVQILSVMSIPVSSHISARLARNTVVQLPVGRFQKCGRYKNAAYSACAFRLPQRAFEFILCNSS